MNGDYLDRRAEMWTKIRMESESHLRGSRINRLFELGLVDPIVAVYLDSWRRGTYTTFEHMLLDLVAAQTEHARTLVDKLTLAKQLEPVSVVIPNETEPQHKKAIDDRFYETLRQQFQKVVPGLCSGSWEDIYARVRDKFREKDAGQS